MQLRLGLFLLGSIFLSELNAQITIVTSDMPKSGDTIRYSTAPITDAPDLTKTGANQTWDFKYLGLSGQDIYDFKASGQTPYILNFGFSAIGLKIADTLGSGQMQLKNVYNFFKNSSTTYEGVGIGFTYSSFPLPQSGKHSDPDEIYSFPLNYTDNKNTTFKVTVPISLSGFPIGNYYQEGTRNTQVDGWGKISTPYATNVDCIRVKAVIEERDSVAISTPALNFGFTSKRIEYKWLSKTERIPLLEISGTETNGNFVVTYIRYRDNYREVSGPVAPVAAFDVNKTSIFKGDSVSLTDKSTGIVQTYEWTINPSAGVSFVGGTSNTSANPKVKFNNAGKYTVTLKVSNPLANNSLTKSDFIEVLNPVGIEKIEKTNLPFPNPVNSIITLPSGFDSYRIIDITGKTIMFGEVTLNGELALGTLSPGLFYLHLNAKDGTKSSFKILKK